MKKLTKAQLKKIVCYTNEDGVNFFYSRIKNITSDVLTYDNETYTIPNTELYDTLTQGLMDYEIYRLSMSNTDAEELINEKAEKLIESQYAERFQAMSDIFSNMVESVENTLIASASKATSSAGILNNISEEMTALSDTVVTMHADLDIAAINNKVRKKLDELAEVKEEIIKTAAPVTAHVSSLINKLEKLVATEA